MNWKRMPEGKERYAAYLCSREWSVLKESVKLRSRGKCERCTLNPMDHVHHLTYARKYAERLEDLQACCKKCHEFIHGKSDVDPADDRPVEIPWCRRKVKSFYLAGKITGTNWRDEIVSGWSDPRSESFGSHDCESGLWRDVQSGCTVMGIALRYAGPWWKDVLGGHGVASSNSGPHAYGDEYMGLDDYAMRQYAADRKEVRDNVVRSVSRADMVFAWIDSGDCYGTIFEIGYARALNKVVVVGVSESFKAEATAMWLPLEGCYCLHGSCALDVWNEFWDLVAFEQDSPDTFIGWEPNLGPVLEALFESMRHADESDMNEIYDAASAIATMTCRGTIPLSVAVLNQRNEATDGPHTQH